MANANPYQMSRTEEEFQVPEYAATDSAYAVPGIEEDAPYIDELGWSPHLRLSTTETPDSARLGDRPLRDFYSDSYPNPEQFYDERDSSAAIRHSVEDIDANGWKEVQGVDAGDRRWADPAMRTPPPDNRVTQDMSPRSYSYTRPFDQQNKSGARYFSQLHFSMADHRRVYEVPDMAPVRTARNTYRMDPPPWDANLVDVPAPQSIPNGRVQAFEVAAPPRNYRLA